MFEKSSINQAVTSVYKTLQNRLIKEYNMDIEESEIATEKLLEIHGMSRNDFSVIDRIEKMLEGSLNDNSIDDNSNKNSKTVKGLMRESLAPFEKITGYRYLYREMAEIYGKKEAKRLTGLMYDFTLAISDSTNIAIPYCWAFDASKLVTTGKPFGQLPSAPVKRVESYTSLLNEVIHQLSNSLAGAIAVGTFFLDIAHLMLMKEGKTIEDLKEASYRKWVENQYQKVVHGFNSLSRSGGVESPFTNISLFDRNKLRKLLEEYNWYFLREDGTTLHDVEYIIEFIMELQSIYMEFFDKGDPSNGGMPYRFPVSTLNISKKRNKEGEWVVEDKPFLKSACKKDIYRYNIFVSEGEKISSCCRLINDTEMMSLAAQANSFGAGGSVSLGSHRVITINFVRIALMSKSKEDFYKILDDHIISCKKILAAHKKLLYKMKYLSVFTEEGWVQLERMFSTVGIIGYVEMNEIMKSKNLIDINEDFIYDTLIHLNTILVNDNEKFPGLIFNIEQIPAESMAHRLPRADKAIFGSDVVPYNILANQFVPLWDTSATVWDRLERDGKCLSVLTGGGISHINAGEHITGKQAESIINFAIEKNAEHFAITGTFCKCEDSHVVIGNTDVCSVCGKSIIDKIARTVGFFVPVRDMSSYKQEYDHKNRKEYINGDFNKKEQ